MTEQINQLDSQNRPHGVWKSYRPDGTLYGINRYYYGMPRGVWEFYLSNKRLVWKQYHIRIK